MSEATQYVWCLFENTETLEEHAATFSYSDALLRVSRTLEGACLGLLECGFSDDDIAMIEWRCLSIRGGWWIGEIETDHGVRRFALIHESIDAALSV